MTGGLKKEKACRFKCGKSFGMDFARNNHETHCKLNVNRGRRPLFSQDEKGRTKYIGFKECD